MSHFTKVLVANRGAIARRVIHACESLGIASVAVYSDPDGGAPYLAEASEAVSLPGDKAVDTYLNQEALLRAVMESGADAVHPGYGFLAENADFAEAVQAAGATFIGPDPKWLRTMGDKVAARALAEQHGFPVFSGSPLVATDAAARTAAAAIGYPLLIKPSAGGGGIGMRVVRNEQELSTALAASRETAARSFADGGVFLERWIERARHIEFQLLGDGERACHVFERECSIQRRHQKVIEESPAPGIAAEEILELAGRAARFAGVLGYDNVGTLETLRDETGQYGFLEMNTRIQVEHGVTEAVTGLDLVAIQIGLAAGEPLPEIPERQGYALEVRVYAEDPWTQLPSPGRLVVFEPPKLFGVRVDTGYQAGQWVTPFYDPLLAKLIGHGSTREQAIGRVLVGLKAFAVQGLKTNIPLLKAVLEDKNFLAGRIDTGFLQRFSSGENKHQSTLGRSDAT